MPPRDLLIIGAGPVGLALALALRDSGLDIALVDARNGAASRADPRVLALAHGTRITLERLGVWPQVPATPIETIHVSQQGGFGRTRLRARDHDVPALGYVTSAGALAGALRTAVELAGIPIIDGTEIARLTPGADTMAATATVTAKPHADTDSDTDARSFHALSARLVVCAEGGVQADRAAIAEHDYDQHALIAFVTPAGGHHHTAFERFTPAGPVALLPCGERYALVQVVSTAQAEQLLALSDAAYIDQLQQCFGQRVQLTAITARLRYPIGLRYRRHPVGQRTVWIGNAAQTLHPVAGQGFNLALRDVWALADTLLRHPGDPGCPDTLDTYARARKLDRFSTIHFTDGLVQLFSNNAAALRHLRGAGLLALDMLPPLRAFVARRMMFGARAWP